SNTSLQQKQVYAAEIANLNIVEINIDKKFVRNNINTLVGTYIFTSSFYNWNLAEKDSIVTLFNDQTKNITRVKEIIADINIEKQLSVGSNFKDFKLANLKGDSISLSNLVGNTDFVLVDYWASWCGSCIQSLPELKVLYAKYKGSRLEILGVSLDDNKKSWSNAIVSHQLSWKHISDLKGWKCAGSRAYAVNSIPCTILIDKKGKIIGRNLQISEIENLIKAKVAKN
ncbi:MAG: TlpA disulfide reductase family protein, partial [Candidatus Riflemargulisbacteria bacterium]